MIKWIGHLQIISGLCNSSPDVNKEINKAILDIHKAGYNLINIRHGLYCLDPRRLEVNYSIESANPREETKTFILTRLLPLIRQSGGAVIIREQKKEAQTLSYFGSDQDGTLLCEEILPLIARADQAQLVKELTQKAMDGREDFASNFTRRSQLLTGCPTEEAIHILEQISLAPMAEYTLNVLKQRRITRDLVTSNYSVFAKHLCLKYGLDGYCASTMEVSSDGILSGRLIPPVINAEGKRAYLIARLGQLGLSPLQSLCIGDGANDIPMLSLAGTCILYCCNPLLHPIPWTFILPYFDIES